MFCRKSVKMIISNMTGTIINDNGVNYKTLFNTIHPINKNIKENDLNQFYGYDKIQVMKYFINLSEISNKKDTLKEVNETFKKNLLNEYKTNKDIRLIDPKIHLYFENLRNRGIRVCLNTEYDIEIKNFLINHFELQWYITDSISSQEVKKGKPKPDMINKLIEKYNIDDSQKVIKIGDSINDILEGKNAKCKTVGVLSGIDTRFILKLGKPDLILNNITQLKIL